VCVKDRINIRLGNTLRRINLQVLMLNGFQTTLSEIPYTLEFDCDTP
jgi:hypothetical protein